MEIDSIYDDAYQGQSIDPDTHLPISTSKADEVTHVWFLHQKASITSITLTYPPNRNRYTDLSDPAGWAAIQLTNPGVIVEINDYPNSYNLLGGLTQEFHFIPHTPDSTSPTDTTWKIIRWKEY